MENTFEEFKKVVSNKVQTIDEIDGFVLNEEEVEKILWFFRMEDKIYIETSRWHVWYEFIFKVDDRYFGFVYGKGATEYQDDHMYDVEVYEVEPIKTVVTTFMKKER